MRFINKTNCRPLEKGKEKQIKKMGALTAEATKIAEANRLGLLKNSQGAYRIIKECGLGAYEDFLMSLEEVDDFFKNLNKHEDTRY